MTQAWPTAGTQKSLAENGLVIYSDTTEQRCMRRSLTRKRNGVRCRLAGFIIVAWVPPGGEQEANDSVDRPAVDRV